MKKAKPKAKKAKTTKLDRIAAQLRKVLRRETTDVILSGNLLIDSRKLLAHREWQPWLAKNFDLSLRTAQTYVAAAEYVARVKSKSATVADVSNLSPTVLYGLAAGHYTAEEEAAILAATRTREGRVDQNAAAAICERLVPPDDDVVDDADDDDDDDNDTAEKTPPDPETEAILDGPPPDVPPPAPNTTTDFALRAFDQAVHALKQLMTKPAARFASTAHTTRDLEGVESFIRAVADRAREAPPHDDAGRRDLQAPPEPAS
jgi:hypothetical protein